MPTVLIAEPDQHLCTEAESHLHEADFRVVSVSDVESIVNSARESLPDIAVISLDFEEVDGLEICKRLRLLPHLTYLPVLFITEKKEDTVLALEAGGDDIIVKPLEMRELVARVRALIRRGQRLSHLNEIRLDKETERVWVNDEEVNLTPTEFSLLLYLCEHRNEFHTAEKLLSTIWNYPEASGDTALVRNHVHNIREKLEKNANRPQIIVSSHGRGYGINAVIEMVQTSQMQPHNQDART